MKVFIDIYVTMNLEIKIELNGLFCIHFHRKGSMSVHEKTATRQKVCNLHTSFSRLYSVLQISYLRVRPKMNSEKFLKQNLVGLVQIVVGLPHLESCKMLRYGVSVFKLGEYSPLQLGSISFYSS